MAYLSPFLSKIFGTFTFKFPNLLGGLTSLRLCPKFYDSPNALDKCWLNIFSVIRGLAKQFPCGLHPLLRRTLNPLPSYCPQCQEWLFQGTPKVGAHCPVAYFWTHFRTCRRSINYCAVRSWQRQAGTPLWFKILMLTHWSSCWIIFIWVREAK